MYLNYLVWLMVSNSCGVLVQPPPVEQGVVCREAPGQSRSAEGASVWLPWPGRQAWVDTAAHSPALSGSGKLMVFHAYSGGLHKECVCAVKFSVEGVAKGGE